MTTPKKFKPPEITGPEAEPIQWAGIPRPPTAEEIKYLPGIQDRWKQERDVARMVLGLSVHHKFTLMAKRYGLPEDVAFSDPTSLLISVCKELHRGFQIEAPKPSRKVPSKWDAYRYSKLVVDVHKIRVSEGYSTDTEALRELVKTPEYAPKDWPRGRKAAPESIRSAARSLLTKLSDAKNPKKNLMADTVKWLLEHAGSDLKKLDFVYDLLPRKTRPE